MDVDLNFDNDLGVDLSGTVRLDITHIPKIAIGVDPLTINPLTINPISIRPLDLSLRIKEIPNVRTHIPALFTLGLSVLGYELVCAKLCGEAQVITEPYEPNPCEHCGRPHRQPTPTPTPVPAEPEPQVPH